MHCTASVLGNPHPLHCTDSLLSQLCPEPKAEPPRRRGPGREPLHGALGLRAAALGSALRALLCAEQHAGGKTVGWDRRVGYAVG